MNVAIIQARMGSTRLPGKVLFPFCGTTILEFLISRIVTCRDIDKIVLAIPSTTENDPIKNTFCKSVSDILSIFRGPEHDVLTRVYQAAAAVCKKGDDNIIEITADCPLVDPVQIEQLLAWKKNCRADYVANCITRTWPDGFDLQVYDFKHLEVIHSALSLLSPYRQHAGWNIVNMRATLVIGNLPASNPHPDWGLTLDTPEDYAMLNELTRRMTGNEDGAGFNFGIAEIIAYLEKNPTLLNINKDVERKLPGLPS